MFSKDYIKWYGLLMNIFRKIMRDYIFTCYHVVKKMESIHIYNTSKNHDSKCSRKFYKIFTVSKLQSFRVLNLNVLILYNPDLDCHQIFYKYWLCFTSLPTLGPRYSLCSLLWWLVADMPLNFDITISRIIEIWSITYAFD